MSKVSIKVGPKTYTIATADGEEEKITALGQVIDGKYQLLGNARAVQETDNLVFASLFLADELEETRKSISEAKLAAESAQAEAEAARAEANKAREELDAKVEEAVAECKAGLEQEKAKNGGRKAEFETELETLRKAEERAREKNDELKAEVEQLREAASQQHDLFGDGAPDGAMIEKLEALAERAEQAADALESGNTAD